MERSRKLRTSSRSLAPSFRVTVLVLTAIVMALAAACSSDVAPGSSTTESSYAGETYTIEKHRIHCTRSGEVRTLDVLSSSGAPLASYVFDASHAEHVSVRWNDGSEGSGAHELELGAADSRRLTCAFLSTLAYKFYQARNSVGASPANLEQREKLFDGWGCSVPPTIQDIVRFLGAPLMVNVDSCASHGACCDTHDACFYTNQCTKESWYHTLFCLMPPAAPPPSPSPEDPTCSRRGGRCTTDEDCCSGEGFCTDGVCRVPDPANCLNACDECNLAAARCFMGPEPGPSMCCDMGLLRGTCNVCGRERTPNFLGCVDDCMCQPNQHCDASSGNCVQSPSCPPDGCYNWALERCLTANDCPSGILDGNCTCRDCDWNPAYCNGRCGTIFDKCYLPHECSECAGNSYCDQVSHRCIPRDICFDGYCGPTESPATCCDDCGCPSGMECVTNRCEQVAVDVCGNLKCGAVERDYGICCGDCGCGATEICDLNTQQCVSNTGGGACAGCDTDYNCQVTLRMCQLECHGEVLGDRCYTPCAHYCANGFSFVTADECGDGICAAATEDCGVCPQDCPCPWGQHCDNRACVQDGPSCGDGYCEGSENACSCPNDCPGTCGAVCGNGVCEGGEDCSSCSGDCGNCGPVCGDGWCEAGEGCFDCVSDCGYCPE